MRIWREKYRVRIWISMTVWALFFILLVVSFVATIAEEEGTLGDSFISRSLLSVYDVLRFPSFVILENWIANNQGWTIPFVLLNSVIWSFLLERVVTTFCALLKIRVP